MSLKSKFRCLAIAAIFSVAVVGCASTSSPPLEPELTSSTDVVSGADTFNSLVSRDVVSVLVQINELSPASTVLGTSSDAWRTGDFADVLKHELESAGYAIRSVGDGQDTRSLGYSLSDNTPEVPDGWQGQSQTVTVMAGDIAVRRSYLISAEGAISPLGKMQVKGVDASTLTLQRDIFSAPANGNQRPDTKPVMPEPATSSPSSTGQIADSAQPTDAPTRTPDVAPEPLALQQTDEQLGQTSPADIASPPEKTTFLDLVAPTVPVTEPSGQAILAIKPDRDTQNVMELQQSNFEDLFADMAFVSEKILTFANDSTRMGDVNKVRLQELVGNFEAESDIFSLVGCSLGQTNYTGGQEALARGRAMRVREELLYAGIPEDRIVEEGCWAEEAFDLRMPRRGVVVTLKRQQG